VRLKNELYDELGKRLPVTVARLKDRHAPGAMTLLPFGLGNPSLSSTRRLARLTARVISSPPPPFERE
jgi:hypothetical protein